MPDFLTVCNLAKVLGVPAAYFYAEDDQLAELVALFGRLNADEHKTLMDFAASLAEKCGGSNMDGQPVGQ